MQTKTTINGHIVSHDETVSQGIRYLMFIINEQEKKVFFDEAFAHGSAIFEDHMGYKFKLIYTESIKICRNTFKKMVLENKVELFPYAKKKFDKYMN